MNKIEPRSNTAPMPVIERLIPFLLAVCMALLSGSLAHTRMVQIGQPSSFYQFFLDHLFSWSYWATLFFLIQKLALRWDIRESMARLTSIFRHMLFGLGAASVKVTASVTVSMLLFRESFADGKLFRQINAELFWKGPVELFTYGALLAIAYALIGRRELRTQEAAAIRLSGQLAQSQLESLQRQLHPHFLFNSLNAVSVLIKQGETAKANQMLELLSQLLRRVMTLRPEQEVPLAEELTYVDSYLAIEQIRFGDRLTIRRQLDPNTSDALVPAFALQGLVENAIRHGVSKAVGAGSISIRSSREAEQLRIELSNSGAADDTLVSGHGVGLVNLRSRLESLYGQHTSLQLEPQPDGSMVCLLLLPYRTTATLHEI